jgi:glucokinase
MRMIVGVDIGGTNIVVGTMTEDGTALYGLGKERTDVAGGGDGVVAQIGHMIKKSIADARNEMGTDFEAAGVGIGAPGPLDRKQGVVLLTPNLGWKDFPLRDKVTAITGIPTTLDNDANCAILGEWWRGAARESRIVVGLTIGTGIGGGIVIDGHVYHGISDIAGELGHMTIDSTGRRCKCGNYGCLEAYASGSAIADRAVEGLESNTASSLPDLVNGNLSEITAHTVYDAAHDGDAYALEVIRDTARFLGAGVANLINIFNPETVVICGGVTAAGDQLFKPLQSEVARRAFRPAVAACRIVPGSLPGTAGVFGAAAAFKVQAWGAA